MKALSYARYLEKTYLPKQQQQFKATHAKHQKIIYPPYEPASWQAEEFHASDKHIKALFGGDRAAKTGTVSAELIKLQRQFPGELFWVAGLTQDKLYAIWQWHKKLLAPEEISSIRWRVRNEIPEFYRTNLDCKVEFKTWNSGAGSFSADSVKAIQLDEDGQRTTTQAEQIYNDCLSRILDNNGYILLGATPVLGKNWMYRRIRKGDPNDIASWLVSLQDNKFIDQESKDRAKGRLTEDELDRRFYGMFTTLSGACFKEFNADIHNLKEEPYIGADWRRIRVIDFGYEHPFYCGWYAEHDGVVIQYDEHHQNHTLLEEHANIIYDKTLWNKTNYLKGDEYRPIEATLADHDAQERAELSNSKLGNKAIYTTPAQKDVKRGIQIVNRYLKIDQNRKSTFYISPRCPVAQSQFETYHYKIVREGLEEKEVPVKIDDEAPDCGRYALVHFDMGKRRYLIN